MTERFVPCADEVGRLQRGHDNDCKLFQKIAEQGHYGGRIGASRQGIYAATPGGFMLASGNTNDPGSVARMLEKALKKWDALPPDQRVISPDVKYVPTRRNEYPYPKDGLVLKGVCRDAPRDNVEAEWRNAWNVEYTWFRAAEAKGFAPPEARIGATYAVPRPHVARLARFSMRDIVRGESDPFTEKNVEKAALTGTVTAIENDVEHIEFKGATRVAAEGEWAIEGLANNKKTPQKRGYEAQLLGHADYDLKTQRFKTFELVALGPRWGGTQFNVRATNLEPFPMAVVLQLAADTPADHVAPAYLYDYGW